MTKTNINKFSFREGTSNDIPFLKEMLLEAVFWNPSQKRTGIAELFSEPEFAKSFQNWDRESGDFALIASNVKGQAIGAAWYRFGTEENHSYGFVDEATPELGIAVIAEARSKGVGTRLMHGIIKHAKTVGCQKISLSVEPHNDARNFYEKLGFQKVGESGTSWTMVLDLLGSV